MRKSGFPRVTHKHETKGKFVLFIGNFLYLYFKSYNMKRILVLMMLCQNITAWCQTDDNEKIKQLNEKWASSYCHHDTTTLSKILADDFVLVSPVGRKMNKWDLLRNASNKSMETTIQIDSVTTRVFGNTGIITAYTSFETRTGDQTMKGKNCYSDLYVKRDGQWTAVAAHVTLLKTDN